MSIAPDREIVAQTKKPRVRGTPFREIDLLNYSSTKFESSSYDSDKSSSQLDLLLRPCDIDRLVAPSSNDESSINLSPSCGEAKKPGFYLRQDMKTINKSKPRKFQEGSDCVLETLLPKIPSRCRNNYSSHSLLRRDSHEVGLVESVQQSNPIHMDTSEEEYSSDDGRNVLDDPKDLLMETINKKTIQPLSRTREDLLSDEWLYSLNPRIFCKRRDTADHTSISDQTLLRKDKLLTNIKGNSLSDLTQPFFRMQRKLVERDVEKDLRTLGFSNEVEVNWNSHYCPKRRDVLRVIHYRLCNHISPDIVIVLDDHEFFCHRILLQSYSEYFDDLKNADTTQRVDITNMNITENAFLTIYTWMLSIGQSGFQLLTKRNILEVLLACQILKIKDLENQCMAFIENEELFSEDTAFFLFQNAVELRMKTVQSLMVPRIKNFFLMLVASKDFLELSAGSACTFFNSDFISVNCELEVFYSGVRWLRHMWTERKAKAEEVMACVRFGLMTPLELVDIRNTELSDLTEITDITKIQRFIDEGLAMAVKNTLCKGEEEKRIINQPPQRNSLGKSKTYKCYKEFLDFLKEIKKDPGLISSLSRNLMNRCTPTEFPRREPSDYHIHISDKSQSGRSLTIPDSGITSSSGNTPVSETRIDLKPGHMYKSETIDVSTNTCHEIQSIESLMPAVIGELIKKQVNETLEESECSRLPQAKLSEPVIQTRGSGSRPRLRDQAATVIQAAYRGHLIRLRLLEALSVPSRHDSSCKVASSNDILAGIASTVIESTRWSSSHSVNHITSDTKLHEELTKNGSTFHLFQNTILVFGGLDPNVNLGHGNTCTVVYRYVGDKNKWETFATLPEPRYYHDVAVLRGRVYLAGGADPRKEDREEKAVCKTVWSMDPSSGIWQQETDMMAERKNFGLISAGGYLYAIGGQSNDSSVLSSVERYDPNAKKWSWVASLEHGRTGAAICKHNHMIWVAGGIAAASKHQVIKHVECYDPKRDVWMTKSPLRFGRAFGCLVSLRGNLYLIGGASRKSSTAANSTPAIDVWDERNKEWKLKTELSIARHSHSVAYIGSQMVILGGTTTMSMRCVTTVESWCVTRGTWVRGIASLPANLIGHATITLPLDVP